MAWSARKNQVFFARAKNWAATITNLLEERDRLIDIYTNEANGDVAFVDTDIATTAEVVQLAGVMNALNDMVNNGTVAQVDRIPLLTPFLAEEV